MNITQIGLIYNELRDNKVIFSEAVQGRRRSENSKEAASILRNAHGRFRDLEDFLKTQGLRLVVREMQACGVAGDGVAYIAIRDANETPPAHLAWRQVLTAFARRSDETEDGLKIWGVFLTLLMLRALYTDEERPIEAVSTRKDPLIDIQTMFDYAAQHVETLRASGPREGSREKAIHASLTSLTDSQRETRIRKFFQRMVELDVLETAATIGVQSVDSMGDSVYVQTLWSAVDIAENFHRYAPHLLYDDIVDGVDTIGIGDEATYGTTHAPERIFSESDEPTPNEPDADDESPAPPDGDQS